MSYRDINKTRKGNKFPQRQCGDGDIIAH